MIANPSSYKLIKIKLQTKWNNQIIITTTVTQIYRWTNWRIRGCLGLITRPWILKASLYVRFIPKKYAVPNVISHSTIVSLSRTLSLSVYCSCIYALFFCFMFIYLWIFFIFWRFFSPKYLWIPRFREVSMDPLIRAARYFDLGYPSRFGLRVFIRSLSPDFICI